jgi:hypothetical protein
VGLNLFNLPGLLLPASVTSLIGGLSLNMDAVTSWATGTATSTGCTATTCDAELIDANVKVSLVGGLISATIPLNLTNPITSTTDLVSTIVSKISSCSLATCGLSFAAFDTAGAALAIALPPLLSLKADYQTYSAGSSPGGVTTVSGLHLAVLGTVATADLALSTVGPNTTPSVTVSSISQVTG